MKVLYRDGLLSIEFFLNCSNYGVLWLRGCLNCLYFVTIVPSFAVSSPSAWGSFECVYDVYEVGYCLVHSFPSWELCETLGPKKGTWSRCTQRGNRRTNLCVWGKVYKFVTTSSPEIPQVEQKCWAVKPSGICKVSNRDKSCGAVGWVVISTHISLLIWSGKFLYPEDSFADVDIKASGLIVDVAEDYLAISIEGGGMYL